MVGRLFAGLAVAVIGGAMLFGARLWWRHMVGYNRRVSRVLWRRSTEWTDDPGEVRRFAEQANRWFGAVFLLFSGVIFSIAGVVLMVTAIVRSL